MTDPPSPPSNGGKFQKGRSGNPKGRPRKTNTVAESVRKALDEKVDVNSGGRRRRMTKREAAATQLANKSASGDLRAHKLAFDLVAKAEASEATAAPAPEHLSNIDQEIIERFIARMGLIRQHQEKTDEPDYQI
jgi:hypothetical protein